MSAAIEEFCGIWRLADWSVALGDDSWRPFGGRVDGYLSYHPGNWVSATLMERDRPDTLDDRLALRELRQRLQEESSDLPPGVIDDLGRYFVAASGYISYSGPFSIDSVNVHHHVAVSLTPQWVGTTLTRAYTFASDGEQLTLEARMGQATDRLIWERLD